MKNPKRSTRSRAGKTILKVTRTLHGNISKCYKNKLMLLSVNVVFKLRPWIISEPNKTSSSLRLTISNLKKQIFSREWRSLQSLIRGLRSIEKSNGSLRVMISDTTSTLRKCRSSQEWTLVSILKGIKTMSITLRNSPNTTKTGRSWLKIMLSHTTELCIVCTVSTPKLNSQDQEPQSTKWSSTNSVQKPKPPPK